MRWLHDNGMAAVPVFCLLLCEACGMIAATEIRPAKKQRGISTGRFS
jgi:hypothetical protein